MSSVFLVSDHYQLKSQLTMLKTTEEMRGADPIDAFRRHLKGSFPASKLPPSNP